MSYLNRICCLGVVFAAALRMHAAEINVFAAASLSETLRVVAKESEQKSGDKPIFNFGASSTLARQIEEGAPADIFFSADEAKMDALENKGRIVKATRKSRLSNSLVIVITADSPLVINAPSDLTNTTIKRIALAEPKAVPAGIYSKQYLEKLQLWALVEPKVVPTENVRGALAAVESGNVEAGLVYKTDAMISKKVKIAHEIPANSGPPISYPMALVTDSKQPEAARAFLKYLSSADATKVFERFGFIVRSDRP
jgi:molybdate transport system substrate-binding protein